MFKFLKLTFMKSLLVSGLVLAIIFSACSKTEKNSDTQKAGNEPAGEAVNVLTVSELLANPEKYDAMEIALKGTVVHVCKHSGKRLHLLDSDESSQLRVEAGEIGQFDKALEGSDIIARGVFHLANSDPASQSQHEGVGNEGSQEGQMMEGEPGEMAGNWLDGISFEAVPAE